MEDKCFCHGNVGRSDQKCSFCQNQIRRSAKRGRNRYKAHGPCQTNTTRTWRRVKKIVA